MQSSQVIIQGAFAYVPLLPSTVPLPLPLMFIIIMFFHQTVELLLIIECKAFPLSLRC